MVRKVGGSGPGIGGPEGQNDRESCRGSEEEQRVCECVSLRARAGALGRGQDPRESVRGRPSPRLTLPWPFPRGTGVRGSGSAAAACSRAETTAFPVCQGQRPGGPPQPLAPGQGPPASRRCGTPRGLLRERGAFLCAFPSQVCSEARSGARRCRLALAGGGGRAPEQGRVAPLPGGFLFAALPRITSKESHGWRRQRVLFCDAFKESARLLVSMASFLVALHRRVAPRACAGAGPGAGRLPCPAGGMRVGSPCVSQRCGGLSVRAEGLCSVSVSRTICRARDRSFACPSTIPYLLTERLVRLLKITVWKRR